MRTLTTLLSVAMLLGTVIARGDEPVKKQPAQWRTFVTILGVSEETTLEVTLPKEKKARVFESGQGVEIPVTTDAFALVVQMKKGNLDIKPCEIAVEQVTSFDRRYICTAQGNKAQVQVRVYTNLHNGERFQPKSVLAKK